MKNEKLIPISWNAWDSIDTLFNNYYDIEFTEDFGKFKKGEKYKTISIDYANGRIEAYDEEGENVVKFQNFVGAPVPENKDWHLNFFLKVSKIK